MDSLMTRCFCKQAAVPAFQSVLRADGTDAAAWEGLASAYLSLSRFTAALKVAIDLIAASYFTSSF